MNNSYNTNKSHHKHNIKICKMLTYSAIAVIGVACISGCKSIRLEKYQKSPCACGKPEIVNHATI